MALSPGEEYRLAKSIWTHDDFDSMGWHDVTIHAMRCEPRTYELLFDIDYIFAWVAPEPPLPGYSFWISTATLVFRNVLGFSAEIDGPPELEILDITRSNPRPPRNAEFIDLKTEWDWHVELVHGAFDFAAAGFEQFIRRKPAHHSSGQCFSMKERNGISFERTALEL